MRSNGRGITIGRALPVLAGLVLGGLVLAGCGGADSCEDPELAELVTWMTGSFGSGRQAATDDDYYDIRLRMEPIWAGSEDGCWLYVEQAVAGNQGEPYRQRVYHVFRRARDRFVSEVYRLPGEKRFVGAWRDPAAFAALSPDSLLLREGCAITLRRTGERSFAGSTSGRDCGSDLRGASYATSEALVTPDRLESWDRGFDADGNQVWGAEKGPYVFDKLGPNRPGGGPEEEGE